MPKDMSHADIQDPATSTPLLRKPVAQDGAEIWRLVRDCKPLDENSMYCNLIQADHFADTCVVAEVDGEILGWISGHMIPGDTAFFVWQVAVSPKARGLGLGGKMLKHLTERPTCRGARHLKTTITKSNEASWALFRSFARRIGGELSDEAHYHEDDHFRGHAPTEHMVTITLPERAARLRVVA